MEAKACLLSPQYLLMCRSAAAFSLCVFFYSKKKLCFVTFVCFVCLHFYVYLFGGELCTRQDDMKIAQDEIFGPVMSVMKFK